VNGSCTADDDRRPICIQLQRWTEPSLQLIVPTFDAFTTIVPRRGTSTGVAAFDSLKTRSRSLQSPCLLHVKGAATLRALRLSVLRIYSQRLSRARLWFTDPAYRPTHHPPALRRLDQGPNLQNFIKCTYENVTRELRIVS